MPDDPQQILTDALEDQRRGRFEEALTKHIWVHEHALEHDSSFAGVRLSFALMWWVELGQEYPPALARLREIRDVTRHAILAADEAKEVVTRFVDLKAINSHLGEDDGTCETFEKLESTNPQAARSVYHEAQPALVRSKAIHSCGRYLEPETSIAELIAEFDHDLKWAEDAGSRSEDLKFAFDRFSYEVATLTALLVLNGRQPEAEKVATAAIRHWSHGDFPQLTEALRGTLPPPWP